MGLSAELPFQIGTTLGVSSLTDGNQWEGREYLVEDLDYSQSPPKPRGYTGALTGGGNIVGELRTIRVVRNTSGIALLPAYLVQFDPTAYGYRIAGYANTNPQEAYPVDEFLPAAGVANNDLFYIVTSGKASVRVSKVAANANFSQGSILCADTAAASTFSTTAGRVTFQVLTGATAPLANQIQFAIGIALSAATTNNTDTNVLAHIWPRMGV